MDSKKRTTKPEPKGARTAISPGRGSWTALLAATTLGVAGASTLHAEVRTDARLQEGRSYRLIVQSYNCGNSDTVGTHDRPTASTQRAVTPTELRDGVRVGLLELGQASLRRSGSDVTTNLAKALVLAWVEEGKPDLEFDALRARPQPGSISGAVARAGTDTRVQISVRAGRVA